jgi:hypothetical protein
MNVTDGTSQGELEACCLTMYASSVLEKYFSGVATEIFDVHASFLTEQLDFWYHGGFEDLATNVGWKWSLLTQLLA